MTSGTASPANGASRMDAMPAAVASILPGGAAIPSLGGTTSGTTLIALSPLLLPFPSFDLPLPLPLPPFDLPPPFPPSPSFFLDFPPPEALPSGFDPSEQRISLACGIPSLFVSHMNVMSSPTSKSPICFMCMKTSRPNLSRSFAQSMKPNPFSSLNDLMRPRSRPPPRS